MNSTIKTHKLILFFIGLILFLANSCELFNSLPIPDFTGQEGHLNDIDGNDYKTIGVGSQIWMAENLRTSRLNDNTEIPYISDSLKWINLSTSGYCWYKNDSSLNIPYGALYNWNTINSNKVCPIGWHVPSEQDWIDLLNNLGGNQVAGGKLKMIGQDYWNSPNSGATNTSNFNAVASGGNFHGEFLDFQKWCHLWSTTMNDKMIVITVELFYKSESALIGPGGINYAGLSVRCIKDKEIN